MPETFHFFWSGPFSQWHPSPFTLGGKTYSCAEQFMMAEKARLFGDTARETMIMATSNPREQKHLGRMVLGFDEAVWNQHAQAIVKRGSLAKYTQNPDLLTALLATNPHTLVEASPYDCVWGIGFYGSDPRAQSRDTWRGLNWLGQILTEVREELLRSTTPARKIAVVGSRNFSNPALVAQVVQQIAQRHPDAEILSGGARGVDTWAVDAAKAAGLKTTVFPADWDQYGRGAGMIRNSQIVEAADTILAFHDGVSRGTLDTIRKAREAGKKVRVITR